MKGGWENNIAVVTNAKKCSKSREKEKERLNTTKLGRDKKVLRVEVNCKI